MWLDAQGQKPHEVLEYFADAAFPSFLPETFYPYANASAPEAYINYLSILRGLLDSTVVKPNPSLSIHDTVVAAVTPVGLSYRERQRLKQLIDLVGLRTVGLIPAPLAAAVAHSLDLNPTLKEGDVVRKLILDIGSRHIQSCIVEFENVKTNPESKAHFGARATNLTSEIREIECSHANMMGSHALDLMLADEIVKRFNANDSEEIPTRVYRTIAKLASNAKHALSVSPQTRVMYDNLLNSRDLNLALTRKDFEAMMIGSSWYETLAKQLKSWRKKGAVQTVELIGNGWRVPKLHEAIANWFGAGKLSMKCNPDEAAVVGATVLATNHSQVYKFKPTYLRMKLSENFRVSVQMPTADEKSTMYAAVGQPISIPSGSEYGSRFVYKADNVEVSGDHMKISVETGDGKALYNSFKLTGFDTIKKMRKRSSQMVEEKRKMYDDAISSNFTTTATTQANETVSVQLPTKHEWIEISNNTQLENATVDNYNLTVKVEITPSGLVSVKGAYVNWLDVQVQEKKTDHQIVVEELAESTTLAPSSSAEAEVDSTTPVLTEEAQSIAEGSETAEVVETAPPNTVTVSSYEWRVTRGVKRNRSLHVAEIDISTKEAEESRMIRPLPFTKRELIRLRDSLQERVKKDQALDRLNEMKNTLEANIYKLKDQLRTWQSSQSVEKVEADEAEIELNKTVDWLFSTNIGAEAVTSKMAEIDRLAKSLKLAARGTPPPLASSTDASGLSAEMNQSKHVEL